MQTRACTFLTFQPSRGQHAAEAMQTYVDLFDDGEVVLDRRRPAGDPGGEGTIFLAEFVVAGQRFRCSDSSIGHAWDFSPAVSVWVDCGEPDEQQRLFEGLGQGGQVFMPLDDYGFGRFGWVQDRFGVSWQLAVSSDDESV